MTRSTNEREKAMTYTTTNYKVLAAYRAYRALADDATRTAKKAEALTDAAEAAYRQYSRAIWMARHQYETAQATSSLEPAESILDTGKLDLADDGRASSAAGVEMMLIDQPDDPTKSDGMLSVGGVAFVLHGDGRVTLDPVASRRATLLRHPVRQALRDAL